MLFSSALSWLNSVTENLFVRCNRPLFIVVNTLPCEEFANGFCHLLAVNGADVVTLLSAENLKDYDYVCYDAVFKLENLEKSVLVTISKSSKNGIVSKKKRFPLNTFGQVGNIYNL